MADSYDIPKENPRRLMWHDLVLIMGLLLLMLAVYWVLAGDRIGQQSIAPYFAYLADAFLHGHVSISDPPGTYDLILYKGAWFVAQQPLPAIIMLPLVALRGSGVSDVAVGVLFGAFNVIACYGVLRAFVPELTIVRRIFIVLFFGLGTTHLVLSTMGTVWFLGQVVTTFFVWGFLFAIARRWFGLAGLMLGLVLLGRPSIVPAGLLLLLGMIWLDRPQGEPKAIRFFLKKLMQRPAVMFWPLFIVCGLVLAAYNVARFNDPLDFGYDHLQDAANIREKREEHGLFSLVFLPNNLYIATIKPITVHVDCLTDSTCGVLGADLDGNGLLWTSPALLLMAWVRGRTPEEIRRLWLLGAVSVVALLPSLFYHNSGSAQFGYRFALDALPFAIIMIAHGARRSPLWVVLGLVIVSIGIQVWGTYWFMNQLGV